MAQTLPARLAAKHKRWKDWTTVAEHQAQPLELRAAMKKLLAEYESALGDCWQKQEIDATIEGTLANLERELEQSAEESRMRVVGRRTSNVGQPA